MRHLERGEAGEGSDVVVRQAEAFQLGQALETLHVLQPIAGEV